MRAANANGALSIAVAAIAIPVVRSRGDDNTAPAAAPPVTTSSSARPVTESEFEVNSWPLVGGQTCSVAVVNGLCESIGAAQPLTVVGFGPGLAARAAGKEPVKLTLAQGVELGADFQPDATVTAIDRIVIGLDQQPPDHRVCCDAGNVDISQLPPGQHCASVSSSIRAQLKLKREKGPDGASRTFGGAALGGFCSP